MHAAADQIMKNKCQEITTLWPIFFKSSNIFIFANYLAHSFEQLVFNSLHPFFKKHSTPGEEKWRPQKQVQIAHLKNRN